MNSPTAPTAIFPASLLPMAKRWHALSKELPNGSVLLVLPPAPGPSWDALFGLAADLESLGSQVRFASFEEETYVIQE